MLSTAGTMRGGNGLALKTLNASTMRVTEEVALGIEPCPGVSTAVRRSHTGTFCVTSTLKMSSLADCSPLPPSLISRPAPAKISG